MKYIKNGKRIPKALLVAAMAMGALLLWSEQKPTEPKILHTNPTMAPVIPDLDNDMIKSAAEIYRRGASRGMRPDVFAKMGDSITAYPPFLFPIGDGKYDVDRHWRLLPVIDKFSMRKLEGGKNSFNRDSYAGVRAWGAEHALDVSLSPCPGITPVECEIKTIKPAFAIVMFGTNNVDRNYDEFVVDIEKIIVILIREGVVPILSTIPDAPWTKKAAAEAHMANRVILEIAIRHKIPALNYWRALQDLPNKGISYDGVHPSVAPEGSGVFTEKALRYGHNVRSFTFLQTLGKLSGSLD
ncbi:MAG: SGNH/GDSL hydrolase family protein [Nitrospinota bacterium]|nr:SGNH/GDSL hydrolase family protein [Nitrospinota bacterium]